MQRLLHARIQRSLLSVTAGLALMLASCGDSGSSPSSSPTAVSSTEPSLTMPGTEPPQTQTTTAIDTRPLISLDTVQHFALDGFSSETQIDFTMAEEPCPDREHGRVLPAIPSGTKRGVFLGATSGVDQRTVYWFASVGDASAAFEELVTGVGRRVGVTCWDENDTIWKFGDPVQTTHSIAWDRTVISKNGAVIGEAFVRDRNVIVAVFIGLQHADRALEAALYTGAKLIASGAP